MRARIALIPLLLLAVLTATVSAQEPEDQEFVGELTNGRPSASFDIPLEEGDIITLTTSSDDGLDTVLVLNGPDGVAVAENDDVGGGVLTSRIVYMVEESGTHTAVVTGFDDATGSFGLTLQYGIDFGLSEAAQSIREENVSLNATTTEAVFTVELAAGDIFVATTVALTDGLDTTLALRDADGVTVTQNDDRGDGTLNSQLVYEVVEAGSYEVIASSYSGDEVGDLFLSLAIDPNAEPPFNFAAIPGTPIAEYTGTLDDDQTALEYPVELSAGQTLLALSDATSGDLDTVLTLLGPDGFPVASNDDRGDGSLNSAVAYTAPSAGTYLLTIERFTRSTSSGDFQLILSSVDASVVDTLMELLDNTVTLSGPEQVIQSPNFLVFYTLEGADGTTQEYAQSVSDTLEEIYDVQVNQIGWAEPVRHEDGFYHAYVADTLAEGAMGYAKSVLVVFDNPTTPDVRENSAARAVFVIDNDFDGMDDKEAPSDSLMRATVTHEFNHVIQFGYDTEEALDWLYESTASWTETTTVGNDQDATDYVTTDYISPELCWTTTDEGYDYAQWTLLQSLADQYGERFVVGIWENSVLYDGFETMEQTLASVNSTIPSAILRWRAQNFARDYDLAPVFERAVWLENTIDGEGEWTFTGAGIQELGANYFVLDVTGSFELVLDGDASLEMVGLGVADGEVQVIPLGREAVFDTSGFEYAGLMVFNSAVPSAPGDCSFIDYSIKVAEGDGAMPAPIFSFSAENFEPLS